MATNAEKESEPFRFVRDDQDRVVMIREGERVVLGQLDQVCEEMARFLAEVDFGE